MKDRLIELIDSSFVDYVEYSKLNPLVKTSTEFIADYILADGWIRPPCKVGQIVYKFNRYNKTIIDECRIRSILQREDGSLKINIVDLRYMSYFEILPDAIGKTVFLTREEAEKALEEGAGNEHK